MFRGDLYFLSNMYPHPIEHNGLVFSCVEAAFQASKCPGRESEFVGIDGFEAKRRGRKVKLRDDWEKRKVGFMLFWLRKKFADGGMKKRLVGVKGPLVEENDWGDRYWGVCGGVGENMLGRLLEQVRSE